MATSNLKLETVEPTDIIDFNVFNENFKKLDKLGHDYITAQGKDGNWWYRKWSSGLAECGIDNLALGYASTSRSKNASVKDNYTYPFYIATRSKFGSYPFSFIEIPSVFVSVNSFKHDKVAYTISVLNDGTKSKSPGFYYAKVHSGDIEDLHAGIYVVGQWK